MEIAAAHGLEAMREAGRWPTPGWPPSPPSPPAARTPSPSADDLCLVHNGSFSNHATIRRELQREGVVFDSRQRHRGRRPLRRLPAGSRATTSRRPCRCSCEVFDGFYTLVVTTGDSFAVVRDAIACKPAIIAETDDYVAMASEYRALAALPGIENARIFEPEPGKVYTWSR